MSTLVLPQARIPIAWVMVNGVRTPAEIDMEWMRTLAGMFERTGGVVGPSNIVNYIQTTVAPSVVLSEGESADSDSCIPGPRGEKGDVGPPGPAIFLMEEPVETEIFWKV